MLEEQINKDYIQAMKAKDSMRSTTLSFLRAQLKNILIEKRMTESTQTPTLEDADVIAAVKKQVKQRQDSIEQFTKGGRQDLADKEAAELVILKMYLPEELSQEALKALVEEVIKETGASSMKDMGSVMKAVLAQAAGQADNKKVSALVKASLG